MNRTYLRLLELSKVILLMFLLSFLGGSRLYAQYFPINTTVQWPTNCERVDRVGDFNTESLSSKYDYIHFERGEGKYAFDDGKEEWYKKSVKTDRFYKPFTKGYIAPWKLVPSGETDVVTARYDGRKEIDLKKVRFVSEPNSAALPARLNETEMTWTISLRSVSTGTSYDVYALYEGEVIGKLRVVSYDKQLHKVTLVPINEVKLDKVAIEQELNTIYNPVGIQFTVDVDESMRGNYDWEVASEKDSLLSTVGKSFWGYDKELKESTEMLNLQKAYQQVAGTLDGAYLFVLNGATGLEGKKDGLLGEMPRKSRFGYIFAGNSPNTETLSHTIAHELGHGIFTLQHTFDYEYAGKKSQGKTRNLMDYDPKGKEIAAFQWNIMAKPAIFTEMDKADEGQIIGTIARISGVNNGIAPNGQVISSIRATNPNNMVVPIIKQSSMFIVGFEIYDEAGSLVKTFNWNNTLDGYTTKANEKLDKSKDIEVIFNVAKENLVARIYEYHGDKCFYRYADVSYNPVRKQVLSTNYVWTTDYLWNANESCKASFIQQQILKRDRTECDSETIKSDKYRLSQINQKTTVKDIVSIVNSCCLNSLRTLDYKTISSFILQISSEKSIEDPDELALIRLMNALNGEDYPSFFNLLEANNNALIRKLVAEIDDASLLFWTGNNYTNFIGTLAWMFGVAPEYSVERWNNIDVSDAFGQVFNLYSQPFTNDIESKNPWLTSLCEFRYSGRYNEETGRISIVREEKVLPQAPYGQVSIPVWTVVDEEVSDLSPLTPIVITTQKDLPLVEIALGGENVMSNQMYIVPAIFLKYRHDKIRNDYIEKGIITTFDVATIALSGGTALATKVHWVRRAWALAEVIGAIGDIAVNTQVASNPRVKEAVDIYNAAMGLIGLKNIGQGGYKFLKNLPERTKEILQKGEDLRVSLQQRYLKWKTLTNNLNNLTDAEKKLLNRQEQTWRLLGMIDDVTSVGKYSLANISKERGFIDMLPELLKKEGLTMDDFHYMIQKHTHALTKAEKAKLTRIRNAMPKPDAKTLMQKVISKDAINNYLREVNPYTTIGGYVTRASDAKHLKTYDDLYYGLRLDYINDRGNLMNFVEDGSCGVIRFKTPSANEFTIPRKELLGSNEYPYTAHGFTSGNNGRLGVPEWFVGKNKHAPIEDGAELWEVYSNGQEVLRAVFKNNKFQAIK